MAAYYLWPAAAGALGHVADLKTSGGYLYSAVATAVAGGLIPYLVVLGRGLVPAGQAVPQAVFYMVFWGWRGVEVDAVYRLQSRLFGDGVSAGTIAIKTVLDQFVYSPFWAAPVAALFYTWKDHRFSCGELRRELGVDFYRRRVAPVLVSTWLVWIPAVALIYALPLPLQIPLFNLVLCFFVLLIAALKPAGDEGA